MWKENSMYRDRQLGWAAMAGTALVLVLALASPASAAKFQMSGTWLMRKGQAFIPLQFGGNAGGTQMTHVSMGSWTEAPFFPTGTVNGGMSSLAQVVRDHGVVTTTGAAPQTLMIPKGHWNQQQKAVIPLSGVNLVQITSMFSVDAPYSTATFMAGGGPGSFTWCPLNAACTVGSALMTAAPTMTMTAGRNSRIVYTAGPNQYGGTMQMGVRFGGLVSVPILAVPFWVGHAIFGGSGTTLRKLAVGAGAADAPQNETVYLARGYVTNPTMVPPMGSLILFPGPFVTSPFFGNTLTMPTGMKFKLPAVTMTSLMTMTAGQYTTNNGFGVTTGTILAQQRTGTGGDDFFAVMGSDARTAGGAGNINTVAGAVARRNSAGKAGAVRTAYAQFDKHFLWLAAPVPSMSPAGFAAAAILILLGVGYALRRRIA
jgi:hypothetical protein